uniref:Uncharacterized protein n=1 Tax=Ditylenchus dipsaci TaxID=166011 RepID=A0A915DFM5_9BILA
MAIQLADYRNKNEEMRLSFRASSKQASETIYKLRHQLSQKAREKNEQVVKRSQEPERVHKTEYTRGFSKSATRTISALREELSKKYIEHSVLSSLHAELQKEMATFKRLETMRADKVIEEYKNKMSQMLENSDNSPNTSENGPSDLNAEYNSFSRESLENVVKTLKQKLADLEKENLFLKVEDANKQNTAVNVILAKQNASCQNADKISPMSDTKRKSSSFCDNKIEAKQVKICELKETAAQTKVLVSAGVTKVKAEEDCMIIEVKMKSEKTAISQVRT